MTRYSTAPLPARLTETPWQTIVVDLAVWRGWSLSYHTGDSRRSDLGWPDLVLAHPGRSAVLFAELKTADGRVSAEQWAWLQALHAGGLSAALWRPVDWPEVQEVLAGRAEPSWPPAHLGTIRVASPPTGARRTGRAPRRPRRT